MKLGTVAHGGNLKVVAVIDEERLLDLSARYDDMVDLVQAGPEALAKIGAQLSNPEKVIALADTQIRCPIMPMQYRDAMMHELHLQNGYDRYNERNGTDLSIPPVWYEQPVYYKGNRFSFIGDGEDVIWPAYSEWMDFELELAAVIGRCGRDISKQNAPDHIFGYTILNDMSARDAQFRETSVGLGPAKGKDFDTGNILGPWILTADEVEHPVDLKMDAYVNGERVGGGRSVASHFNFADAIAHISQSETLLPGEVIGSGTVGTGCLLELGKRLQPDDTIALKIEKIGTLTNTIRRG